MDPDFLLLEFSSSYFFKTDCRRTSQWQCSITDILRLSVLGVTLGIFGHVTLDPSCVCIPYAFPCTSGLFCCHTFLGHRPIAVRSSKDITEDLNLWCSIFDGRGSSLCPQLYLSPPCGSLSPTQGILPHLGAISRKNLPFFFPVSLGNFLCAIICIPTHFFARVSRNDIHQKIICVATQILVTLFFLPKRDLILWANEKAPFKHVTEKSHISSENGRSRRLYHVVARK